MKKLLLLSLTLSALAGARGDSIQFATLSACAATRNNGSVVNIGQPFVGVMSAQSGESLNIGVIPASETIFAPPPPRPPPKITKVTITDGGIQVIIDSAESGSRYILEASTDLQNWLDVDSQTGGDLPLTLDNPLQIEFPYRFYRVRVE